MQEILLVIFLVVALALVGVILLQQGKGAGIGASFGAGASGTVFGAPGSGNVLTKITTVLAIIFFSIALALGYLSSTHEVTKQEDLFDKAAQESVVDEAKPVASDIPVESAPQENQVQSDIPVEEASSVETKAEAKPAEEEKKDDNNGQ